MARYHRTSRIGIGLERLEHRALLAADVSVVNGDLVIQGVSDGDISIVDKGDGTLEVSQKGANADGTDLVNVESGVNNDILLRVQTSADSVQHKVVLDLSSKSVTVDQVMIRLGNASNTFEFARGTINGSLFYLGGTGSDSLLLDQGTDVQRSVFAVLGNGSNHASFGGKIERGLSIRGGIEDDTITILATAMIQNNVLIQAGDGNNSLDDSGKVTGSLSYQGGSGNDSVHEQEQASIDGSVYAQLGDGTNQATVDGAIGRNLSLVSKNAQDSLVVSSTAIVGGNTTIGAGEEISIRRGFRGHGRYRVFLRYSDF